MLVLPEESEDEESSSGEAGDAPSAAANGRCLSQGPPEAAAG